MLRLVWTVGASGLLGAKWRCDDHVDRGDAVCANGSAEFFPNPEIASFMRCHDSQLQGLGTQYGATRPFESLAVIAKERNLESGIPCRGILCRRVS